MSDCIHGVNRAWCDACDVGDARELLEQLASLRSRLSEAEARAERAERERDRLESAARVYIEKHQLALERAEARESDLEAATADRDDWKRIALEHDADLTVARVDMEAARGLLEEETGTTICIDAPRSGPGAVNIVVKSYCGEACWWCRARAWLTSTSGTARDTKGGSDGNR